MWVTGTHAFSDSTLKLSTKLQHGACDTYSQEQQPTTDGGCGSSATCSVAQARLQFPKVLLASTCYNYRDGPPPSCHRTPQTFSDRLDLITVRSL